MACRFCLSRFLPQLLYQLVFFDSYECESDCGGGGRGGGRGGRGGDAWCYKLTYLSISFYFIFNNFN